MDVVYRRWGLTFEWDEAKGESNLRKHGVTFAEAVEVFLDPYHQIGDATRGSEDRLVAIGYSFSLRLLVVVHVERTDQIRIISARVATRAEEERHYAYDRPKRRR